MLVPTEEAEVEEFALSQGLQAVQKIKESA